MIPHPIPQWIEHALCAQTDPEMFYPPQGASAHAAKNICRHCPVKTPCLTHALEHGEPFGIWGGLSPHERKTLRPARKTGR